MGIMAGKINDKKASTELTAEANICSSSTNML